MLASNQSLQQPLNPDVYLNHFSPAEARAFEFRTDITFMIIGAILWDMLTYLHTDIGILKQGRITVVKVCFILPRLFAASYVLVLAVIYHSDIHLGMYILSASLALLSLMASSFLFLQRVLAIYGDYPTVRRCFCVFWSMVALSELVIILGGHEKSSPGSNRYKDTEFKPWISLAVWCLFLFDSAVVVAVTYKIMLNCDVLLRNRSRRLSWYDSFTGRALPEFSRAIFRGGVQYYLITVGMTLFAGFALSLPSVPQGYKLIGPTAVTSLTASMACRVFRNTKLFYSEDIVMETISV